MSYRTFVDVIEVFIL